MRIHFSSAALATLLLGLIAVEAKNGQGSIKPKGNPHPDKNGKTRDSTEIDFDLATSGILDIQTAKNGKPKTIKRKAVKGQDEAESWYGTDDADTSAANFRKGRNGRLVGSFADYAEGVVYNYLPNGDVVMGM